MSDGNSYRKPAPSSHGVVRALPMVDGRIRTEVPPQVRDSLSVLTEACGSNLVAVVFFGSCLIGTSPNNDSAADLVVVVEDYNRFYEDLASWLPANRRPSVMAALNKFLPPNIIYLNSPADMRAGAKCFIVSEHYLEHALSADAEDHFFRGRLSQRVHVVYSRNEDDRTRIEDWLASARRLTIDWVPLYLRPPFSVLVYSQRMLEVSYAGEIRPESRSRVLEVFHAQTSFFRLVYGRLLEDAVARGKLIRVEAGYAPASKPPRAARLRSRLFFHKSKARATMRWLKYMLTFDDWLDYIVRKTERRTGLRIELTNAERRFPAVLLWPKVFHVLREMRKPPEATQTDPERDDG